jgi:GNAT superfamily N-acetyltransferase
MIGVLVYDRQELNAESGRAKQVDGQSARIAVRRACTSDFPAIETFLREAYGALASFKAEDRWNWQFRRNPFRTSPSDFVPVWIAETSGKVVGQIAVQEGEIQVDGVRRTAGWVVDVMILPAFRGLGLGHRIYSAVARDYPFLVTLTMAPATRRMADKLGAVEFGRVHLYSRILKLDHQTVRRYVRMRTRHHRHVGKLAEVLCTYFAAHRLTAHLGNVLLAFRNAVVPLPLATKQTQINEVQRFGPEIDLWWDRVSAQFPVAFTRDSQFLNWRFYDCPQMKYRRFIALRKNEVAGYLVLRRNHKVELPHGIIVDFLAARDDKATVTDLISFALESFGTEVAAIECASSISEFTAVLRKFGFRSVRTERPNAIVQDEEMRTRLRNSSSDWLLSKADHDWDQIRPA